MRRICVQWPRFGPYHLARLRATHQYFAEHGVEVVGLETAGDDATYAWDVEQGAEPFQRVQVFPNRVFETIPADEMHAGVTAALNRLNPDAIAIISYSFPDARACLTWCRRHRRTAILMTSTKADDGVRTWWRERVKAAIVAQYDAALAAGSPQRRYLESLGFPPYSTFQPCTTIDNAFFADGAAAVRAHPQAASALPGLEDDTLFFLASGRFLALKNFAGLLHAYHQYRQAHFQPWRLVLLGDGPERATLEELVERFGIEGVTFGGFRQIEELPAYYARAGAFVHPTFKDTWGLVVNEAMATGLPVLVSDRSGCAEDLVRDGENGFRFDPERLDELARLMAVIASPDTDRAVMGRRSEEIIAGWAPEQFGEGLWQAVQAGRARASRPFSLTARVLLWMLQATAREAKSFHTIKE